MTPMTTFTGRDVDPFDLKVGDVDIMDIAHHLACINRFGGAARFPISVAQHSILVSLLSEGFDAVYARQGLLHDASEAYLGDVIKWFKETETMSAYRELEDAVQPVVYRAFGCPEVETDIVGWADQLAVRFEYHLSYGRPQKVKGYGALTSGEFKAIQKVAARLWRPYMTWQEAEANFLARFLEVQ